MSVTEIVLSESLVPQNPTSEESQLVSVEWYEEAWFWIILICGTALILLIPIILIIKGRLIDKDK